MIIRICADIHKKPALQAMLWRGLINMSECVYNAFSVLFGKSSGAFHLALEDLF